MPPDDYAEAIRLLRALNPALAPPEEGVQVALVAALLPPSNEYRQLLALRRLVEDYLDQHGAACVCRLCVRGRTLTHRDTHPKAHPRLPLDDAPPTTLSGTLFHADGRREPLDDAGVRRAMTGLEVAG